MNSENHYGPLLDAVDRARWLPGHQERAPRREVAPIIYIYIYIYTYIYYLCMYVCMYVGR